MPGSPASLRGDGDRVGDHHEFVVGAGRRGGGLGEAQGDQVRQRFRGGTGVHQDAAGRALRDEGQGGLGNPQFLRLPLHGPFQDAFLGGADPVRSDGPAMDPANRAG